MIRNLLYINFIYLFFTISSAHAYLDPGTGSIILQGIIGALAAGAVFAKIYWNKLLTLLGIKKKADFDNNENIDNKK
jgi:hypothetical protein